MNLLALISVLPTARGGFKNVALDYLMVMRNGHKVLVGKPEGKTPLGRLSRRWEDNIRMCLREIGRVLSTQ
jgi:hypothetical protein